MNSDAKAATVINLPGVAAFKFKPPSPPRRKQRPSQWRHYEAYEQRKLAELLPRLIVPGTCFWTSIENKPRSAISGVRQKQAGVRSGFPDLLFLRANGPPVFVEMKSPVGYLNKQQRLMRLELLAQGARWFMCRSAASALAALHRAGIALRSTGDRPWQPPKLRPWEEPAENPSERHPRHPSVTAKAREAKRHQRAALATQSNDRTTPPRRGGGSDTRAAGR